MCALTVLFLNTFYVLTKTTASNIDGWYTHIIFLQNAGTSEVSVSLMGCKSDKQLYKLKRQKEIHLLTVKIFYNTYILYIDAIFTFYTLLCPYNHISHCLKNNNTVTNYKQKL